MFAGHIGVALAATRVEPRVNAGLFAAASLLLDLLLWLFVLMGWEHVVIPDDFPQSHQPKFVFPWSHGLFACVVWSALAGALVLGLGKSPWRGNLRPATLIAVVVISHWLLDALVHRPELPVSTIASPQLGLGLWNNLPVALVVEASLVIIGMFLFFPGCGLTRSKQLALAALTFLVLALTVVGMTVAPPPPSAAAMAGSSLVTIVFLCALIGWLGSGARARQG